MLPLSHGEVFLLTLPLQLSAPLLQAYDIRLKKESHRVGSFLLTRLRTKTRT